MASGEWHIKLASHQVEKLLAILFSMPFSCFAQDTGNSQSVEPNTGMPSIELLEFLGKWETRHGDWLNPNIFADSEFGTLLDSTAIDDGDSNSNSGDNNDNSDNDDNEAVNGADNG